MIKGVICYVDEETFEKHLRMVVLVVSGVNLVIRGLELLVVLPPIAREGRGPGS